nr:MAG TPA: hypothetical protein [Caudoviricetes sp.]
MVPCYGLRLPSSPGKPKAQERSFVPLAGIVLPIFDIFVANMQMEAFFCGKISTYNITGYGGRL